MTPAIRIIRIFRYDPNTGGKGHYDDFKMPIEDPRKTTILDVLFRIQKTKDPSIAFRYACRVSMCGSCGMIINGNERLACKTTVADIKTEKITLRPLNHFPVVKDLVVDMAPFFEKYKMALPYFDQLRDASEPAIIKPDSKEREDIGLSTECIACGCCVSSCTMMYHHPEYVGPAALNRAFSLLADSRDGLHDERITQILPSCYNCRSEFNCTDVCPKEISPTRAIKYIQRCALKDPLKGNDLEDQPAEDFPIIDDGKQQDPDFYRRKLLKGGIYGLGAATVMVLGGLLASAAIGPAMRKSKRQWIRLGRFDQFAAGKVKTVRIQYDVAEGFYQNRMIKPVMIYRPPASDSLVVFSSRCSHLGCTVRWDDSKHVFLCACHGGAFGLNGEVKAGPPPKPLDRYAYKVEEGIVYAEVV
jgi:succinate dehydrogenase / fumarate reductase iron-sulfur subunit